MNAVPLIKNMPNELMEGRLGITWQGEFNFNFFLRRKISNEEKYFQLRRLTLKDFKTVYNFYSVKDFIALLQGTKCLELINCTLLIDLHCPENQ